MWLCMAVAMAAPLPDCVERAEGQTTEQAMRQATVDERELLARLTYAESISTEHRDDPLVYKGIAWGTMNRVRLGMHSKAAAGRYGSGVWGVVFQPGQFNPAVSKRSRFSRLFLCPSDQAAWDLAQAAADEALKGENNPFLQTDWEERYGVSLVVNFYYPDSTQAKGPLAPWENDGNLVFTGPVPTPDGMIDADKVRFYRLRKVPKDFRSLP